MTDLIDKLKALREQFADNPAILNLEPLLTTEESGATPSRRQANASTHVETRRTTDATQIGRL